ncbi:MAG: GIY-YIG nuclease family protein [Elusimicrobia bacterium]|nr:GIY-YIG nuclease family protein [Elusimicrobiota bacterium]
MKKKKSGRGKGFADRGPAEWTVYLIRCRDRSLYTGITKDVARRMDQHNAGKGAAYTRSRRPVRLYYREDGFTHSQALIREAAIKRFPRSMKEDLRARRGRTPG